MARCEAWMGKAEVLIHSTTPMANEKEQIDACLSESIHLPVHVEPRLWGDWVAEGAQNSKRNPEERISATVYLRRVSRWDGAAGVSDLPALVPSALRVLN